ncbi:MAG: PfkB family carbohydrate kinase, partial [Asgard group archaeon]|nr:PfkB family carbohydrate kinase [Asgard group archaeon]
MELIVVGSITIDKNIFPNGKKEQTIGGPPIYAAATAQALKKKIGIVSKVGTDFQVKYLQTIKNYNSDLNGFRIKGKTSMRFENHYDEKGHRTQKLVSQSEKLSIKDFPDIYFDVPCVHLSPVFHEIPSELFEKLVSSFNFVSCDIQGFVRKKSSEEDNTLILNEWPNYEDFLPKIDLLKVDAQELKALTGESTLTKAIARINKKESVKILVITLAQKGSIIVFNGEQHKIPAL